MNVNFDHWIWLLINFMSMDYGNRWTVINGLLYGVHSVPFHNMHLWIYHLYSFRDALNKQNILGFLVKRHIMYPFKVLNMKVMREGPLSDEP